MNRFVNRTACERGAVLVQVAIAILVLVGFLTFVLDYGVLWIARAQAQNSADAGALAGAIARFYDDKVVPPATPSDTGIAAESAQKAALLNTVWNANTGEQKVEVKWDCPAGVSAACVRVNVYRNAELGSAPLPTFFGPVFNIGSQGVRATATAIAGNGNATDCLRPFAIPDKWQEKTGDLNFEHYDPNTGSPLDPYDVYIPPTQPGKTGYTRTNLGDLVTMVPGSTNDKTMGGNGWSLMIDLPDGNGGWESGSNLLRYDVAHCVGHPVRIGQYVPTENAGTTVGRDGGRDLIAQDPSAEWDPATKNVKEGTSCAPGNCPTVGYSQFSPRIVPIAVFDIEEYQYRKFVTKSTSVCPTGGQCVKVVNILGFFVLSAANDGTVTGRLLTYPGEFVLGPPSDAIADDASFLTAIRLVR
jgi:hypothetical protein